MPRLITVFGSTGNQGGSVVRTILSHAQLKQEWKVRGITRSPDKPDAQKMKEQGVEMVQADLNSKDSILQAIKGSHAVFGVTNYWEKRSMEAEITQGKNLADACKEAGVQHLIWSSLPYASKVSNGKYGGLHHFDSKAQVEVYITSIGLPASFVLAGYFMSNLTRAFQLNEAGTEYTWTEVFAPDSDIPMLDVPPDYGKFVAGCLSTPEATVGKRILATSGWYTPLQVAQAVENVTGKKCVYKEDKETDEEHYRLGGELYQNMMMIKEFKYYGPGAKDGVEMAQKLAPAAGIHEGFSTFEGFLKGVGFGK